MPVRKEMGIMENFSKHFSLVFMVSYQSQVGEVKTPVVLESIAQHSVKGTMR